MNAWKVDKISSVPEEPGVGAFPEKLGGGVPPASQNFYQSRDFPYPI